MLKATIRVLVLAHRFQAIFHNLSVLTEDHIVIVSYQMSSMIDKQTLSKEMVKKGGGTILELSLIRAILNNCKRYTPPPSPHHHWLQHSPHDLSWSLISLFVKKINNLAQILKRIPYYPSLFRQVTAKPMIVNTKLTLVEFGWNLHEFATICKIRIKTKSYENRCLIRGFSDMFNECSLASHNSISWKALQSGLTFDRQMHFTSETELHTLVWHEW